MRPTALVATSVPFRRSHDHCKKRPKPRGETTAQLARRLERGDYRPDELRELADSGAIHFGRRRNPLLMGALTLAHNRAPRRNPCPGGDQAHRQSETFHGEPGEVLCLHGRPHVVLGKAESLTYQPPASSKRGAWSWEHAFGDQGDGKPRLRGRPLVVADAETGQVELAGGPARFEAERGIVG